MLISDNSGSVEISVLDSLGDPDLHLGVRVKGEGFCGHYDGIWISRSDWDRFLTELRTLETNRRGSASFVSMSPGEFDFSIGMADPLGHIAMTGELRRLLHGRYGQYEASIGFEIEVDPTRLRGLIDDFQELASQS